MSRLNRRSVLGGMAVTGAMAGLGDFSFLSRLAPVSADEAKIGPVKFDDSVDPLVRLIEETPQARVLEVVAAKIKQGTTYKEVLAALQLAGIKNVQPRPSVGFKFHAVLVVHSAHLASLSSPESDRWLPIFWAIDEFKKSQSRDVQEGDWTMSGVNESKLPSKEKALGDFTNAMDSWDEEAADGAAAALARSGNAAELFELFARFGARDFRSIGHKAIYVANGFRTLEHIGWQHAEPVLRSITYAMQNHEGDGNPSNGDLPADRPGKSNAKLAMQIRAEWKDGKLDDDATTELLQTLRTGSPSDCCESVAKMLNAGVAVQSISDALYLGSGELVMRQRGIVALHAVTSTNALQYAFRTVTDDSLKKFLLLQNAAFVPLFRDAMTSRGQIADAPIEKLAATEQSKDANQALSEIFSDVGRNHAKAASSVLGWLSAGNEGQTLIDAARRLLFLKGDNSHDYKFSSAILEDFAHVSPTWRNRLLAASVYNLRGSSARDNGLVQRTREALK